MSKPKISVIITVYNTKKNFFRGEVLGSLSQAYTDFENASNSRAMRLLNLELCKFFCFIIRGIL